MTINESPEGFPSIWYQNLRYRPIDVIWYIGIGIQGGQGGYGILLVSIQSYPSWDANGGWKWTGSKCDLKINMITLVFFRQN